MAQHSIPRHAKYTSKHREAMVMLGKKTTCFDESLHHFHADSAMRPLIESHIEYSCSSFVQWFRFPFLL
jgi:hypothetical protein